jgi:hypothetical protein
LCRDRQREKPALVIRRLELPALQVLPESLELRGSHPLRELPGLPE